MTPVALVNFTNAGWGSRSPDNRFVFADVKVFKDRKDALKWMRENYPSAKPIRSVRGARWSLKWDVAQDEFWYLYVAEENDDEKVVEVLDLQRK